MKFKIVLEKKKGHIDWYWVKPNDFKGKLHDFFGFIMCYHNISKPFLSLKDAEAHIKLLIENKKNKPEWFILKEYDTEKEKRK